MPIDIHDHEAFKQSKFLAIISVVLLNVGTNDMEFFSNVTRLCSTCCSHSFELVRKEIGRVMTSAYWWTDNVSVTSLSFVDVAREPLAFFDDIRRQLSHLPDEHSRRAADTGKSLY